MQRYCIIVKKVNIGCVQITYLRKFTLAMNLLTHPNLTPEFQLTKTLETDVGVLFLYGNIVIFQANEGIVMSRKTANSLIIKCLRFLKGKKWILLSNRINSYSVKPMDYKALDRIPSLEAVGIIYYNEIAKSNADLESKFCNIHFRSFGNLMEGVEWAKECLIDKLEII